MSGMSGEARRTDSPATRSDWLCALMIMWLYAISLVAKTCGSSFVQFAPCDEGPGRTRHGLVARLDE